MKRYRQRIVVILILIGLICAGGAAFVAAQGSDGKKLPAMPPTNRAPTSNKAPSRTPTRPKPGQTAPQIEMVLIPAGSFTMGSPEDEAGRSKDEGPQHSVNVRSFSLGKYEVTQAQYREVMGMNPSHFRADNLPVEQVSWNDAVEFCRRLSQLTGKEYRLPSEAEWEYACRAGTTTAFAFGNSLGSEQASFDGHYPYGSSERGIYREKPSPVGSFQPNAFGLYDMHGNVWEWCQDSYHDSYDGAPSDGSAWLGGKQSHRVSRGGSSVSSAGLLRSAHRDNDPPGFRYSALGFRIVEGGRTK